MTQQKSVPAYLILEDGTVFHGRSMGKSGTSIGEVVFNTSDSSYEGLLSDPTYYGQIVVQTYPTAGCSGQDFRVMASGYIVREWTDVPDADGLSLDAFLRQKGIVGLCGVDTRRLTRMLRDGGYKKGVITNDISRKEEWIAQMKNYSITGAVRAVTIDQPQEITIGQGSYCAVVLQYGSRTLCEQGLAAAGIGKLILLPAFATAEQVQNYHPQAVILSDGPGDPDDDPAMIQTIQELTASGIPIFGYGLGHQMLAIACGMKCVKMEHAHRGANQPVRDLETRRLMVTGQNHGYTVERTSVMPQTAEVMFENVNDQTVEALAYHAFPALTVQYEPEDQMIFERFGAMLGGESNA